jgi:hypothetical protein
LGVINHIVMHESGQVDHFDDHRDRQVGIIEFAQHASPLRETSMGRKLFALGGEGISGEGGDLRFELLGLRRQAPGNALQKRGPPLPQSVSIWKPRGVDDLVGTAMPRLDSAANMRFTLSFPRPASQIRKTDQLRF